MVDAVLTRHEMRPAISRLARILTHQPPAPEAKLATPEQPAAAAEKEPQETEPAAAGADE